MFIDMPRSNKTFVIVTFFLVIASFATVSTNKRLKESHENRLRHARSITFLIQSYYQEYGMLPKSLDHLDSGSEGLRLVFGDNLSYRTESVDSAVLEEREKKWVSIFRKEKIVNQINVSESN